MKSIKAMLDWQLYVDCPECTRTIDLVEHDDDNDLSLAIFNNKWDVLKGYETICPYCAVEFKIKEVEY